MKKQYYLPRKDQQRQPWLANFANKITGHAAALGLTAAETASVIADNLMFAFIMSMLAAVETFKQSVTKFKNILRSGPLSEMLGAIPVFPALPAPPAAVDAGIFIRITRLVRKIKASPNYNETIGEDLGIVGDEMETDTSTWKPAISGKQVGSHVEIDWTKELSEGVDIYVDRNDSRGWIFLTRDTQPGYNDTFAVAPGSNPVVWKYKAIYITGDEQVGNFSDEISVTVTSNF